MIMKMMTKQILTLGFLSLVLFGFTGVEKSQAQDLKIGFVDPRAVLERMPEMRAAQQRIQNFIQRKETELAEKEQEVQSEYATYQQRQSVISADARQREEERLNNLQLEFQELSAQAEQEVQQRQMEEMEPLLVQFQEGVDAVSAEQDFDMILNTRTSTGDVIIIYVSPELRESHDITNAVMDHLDI